MVKKVASIPHNIITTGGKQPHGAAAGLLGESSAGDSILSSQPWVWGGESFWWFRYEGQTLPTCWEKKDECLEVES